MKRVLTFLFIACTLVTLKAQQNYAWDFAFAYNSNSGIPKGILEAVAYANTRITDLTPAAESCNGLPKPYGVMGLIEDGKGYFKNNLLYVSELSEFNIAYVKTHTIGAYANAFTTLAAQQNITSANPEDYISVLTALSELPSATPGQNYALNVWLYEVYNFLNTPANAALYNFPVRQIDMAGIFGEDNLKVLSSSSVQVSEGSIISKSGISFNPINQPLSIDYGPALWTAAASCNFSSRNGVAVSAVTIHTVQGTYAGCISWFQNCSAQVSAHYVVRSSDGQITQMVLESDKAWHVGSENPYTIGIEHEGYVDNPAWYTQAMYTASANLCKDICNSGYGINPLRTYYGPGCTGGSSVCELGGCIRIKGHQHYANQSHSDPGPNWDWVYFYNLINSGTPVNTLTAQSGSFYDSGGPANNYADDEQTLTLINPPNTLNITLTFSQFNLEANWDYMYIYDGNSINAPLIGTYTSTTTPGTITSSGNALLIRFRSDCSTTAAGWAATYTSVPNGDYIAPTTQIGSITNWYDDDFTSTYTDADNNGGSGVMKSFYTVSCYDSTRWNANHRNGFYRDDFEVLDPAKWTAVTGTWNSINGELVQSDEIPANTNIYSEINEGLSNAYLYHWRGKIDGTGANRRAGFHFFADDDSLDNHGQSYFVWFRADQDELQFYKVTNNVFALTASFPLVLNTNQWYDFKVSYDRITGKTYVWVDNTLAGNYTDPTPYPTGKYIAFRSGNCMYTVDDFEVYRSRPANTVIQIAEADTAADIWRENSSLNQPAGYIRSIVTDNAGNISAIDAEPVNVAFKVNWTGAVSTDWNNALNWSPPKVPTVLMDAIIPDVTQQSNNFPLLNTGNNAVVKNLSIHTGASVTNANQKTITVTKDLNNKGTINAGAHVQVGN